MRSVIIAWLLLLGCLVGAHTSGQIIENHVTELCTTLRTIEASIHAEDWMSAQAHVDGLNALWQEQEPFWRLLLDHQRQTELEANMLRMSAYIDAQDSAQGLAELASLLTGYEHILLLEQITWNNIL